MALKHNNFRTATGLMLVFGGAFFLLSGACTGLGLFEVFYPAENAEIYFDMFDVIAFGGAVLIPSSLMLWAAIRQIKRGNNQISGTLFLTFGVVFIVMGVFILFSIFGQLNEIRTDISKNRFTYPIIISSLPLLCFGLGGPVFIAGLKIMRSRRSKIISPETFD